MSSTEKEKNGVLGEVVEILKVILWAIVFAAIIVQFIRPTRVDGESMYPTLYNKDYLIINRLSRYYGVDRGDVIVFDSKLPVPNLKNGGEKGIMRKGMDFILQDDSNTKDLVKRVIAIQGDHVVIKDDTVTVNGNKLEEPYVSPGNLTEGNMDFVVPENKIFVMGDNRMNSLDSRYKEVGFVDKKDVVGTILVRLLPASRFGKVY